MVACGYFPGLERIAWILSLQRAHVGSLELAWAEVLNPKLALSSPNSVLGNCSRIL